VAKATIQREKGRKSVATKVALQINCKLGGELWETDMPVRFAFSSIKILSSVSDEAAEQML